MTQMMVAACRINTKDVPMETVCKMVGREVTEQIRADAVRGAVAGGDRYEAY